MEEAVGTRDCGVLSGSVGVACGEAKQDSGQDVSWKRPGLGELASTEPGAEVEETPRVGS